MRIAIDSTPLLVRSAGVKNYVYYWIRHLRELAGNDTITLFPALGELAALDHERSVASRSRTIAALGSVALVNYVPLPLLDWFGPRADIFHSTSLIRRPPRRTLLTTTVHDITTWILPEFHTAANRRADANFEAMLRRADGIMASSHNTARDLETVLRIDPRRIRTIHLGVPQAFFDVTDAEAGAARRHFSLTRPFALFLGTIEPRKNVATLLDAWQALPASLREEFDLVLAGPTGWAAPELLARVRNPAPGIRYLGYVPEEHLAGLTRAATIFVYPSLYEGFGFPPAQALAAGVPVITSSVSSLPEVVGEAGILVDPRSPAELTAAIARLLQSPSERATRAAQGREYAKRFTLTENARRSLQFFRETADKP